MLNDFISCFVWHTPCVCEMYVLNFTLACTILKAFKLTTLYDVTFPVVFVLILLLPSSGFISWKSDVITLIISKYQLIFNLFRTGKILMCFFNI